MCLHVSVGAQCWELNSGTLQERQVFLRAEPSPAPPARSWRPVIPCWIVLLYCALTLVYLLVSHPVSVQQEPCFHLEPWPVCAFQWNYPYFLDWLRTLLWSPTKPCSKHTLLTLHTDPPPDLRRFSVYIWSLTFNWNLQPSYTCPLLTSTSRLWVLSSKEGPIHLPLTLNDSAFEKSTLFLPLSIWFLYADSETKDFFREPSADTSDWWLQL